MKRVAEMHFVKRGSLSKQADLDLTHPYRSEVQVRYFERRENAILKSSLGLRSHNSTHQGKLFRWLSQQTRVDGTLTRCGCPLVVPDDNDAVSQDFIHDA